MQVIAVPVKPLARAKSRLSPLLSAEERARLSLTMLHNVLQASLEQRGWQVWVISRDPDVLRTGARLGARTVAEQEQSLLFAVRQVEASMAPRHADLAIVLADLPLISSSTLAAALAMAEEATVVASPAASDGGTNLLLRRPPSAIPARFGRRSFARHRSEAYRKGLTFREAAIPEIGFDLDRPEDVARLLHAPSPRGPEGSLTRSVCVEMGLAERLRRLRVLA